MTEKIQHALQQTASVLLEKEDVIQKVWMAILADGHILLEDIPGVGKTTLASSISQICQLAYNRIQCTPDLLPSDITGFTMYDRQKNEFIYKEGAVFANLLLVDEINRTSSRTQSALLEAMQEHQVTVDSVTYSLPKPFTVIATQNPIGSVGTQPLPLAQLDRFMLKLSIGYPTRSAQIKMLENISLIREKQEPVLNAEQLQKMQQEVSERFIAPEIYRYITDLVEQTRTYEGVVQGLSPRAAIDLLKLAKAGAYLEGRDYVTPEHVQQIWLEAASHRLLVKQGFDVTKILQAIVEIVPFDKEW